MNESKLALIPWRCPSVVVIPRIRQYPFTGHPFTNFQCMILAVIRELKQQRRQRQRKHHLKINIWEIATIL